MPDNSQGKLSSRVRLQEAMEPAQGFFELGLFNDAWMALDDLPPKDKAHPEVLLLRMDILLGLSRWEDAVALGVGCCRDWSEFDGFFLKTASGLMHLGDYGKAWELLRNAPVSLHLAPEYHYTLARCASRQGLINHAKKSLQDCLKLDKGYRQRVLDDPDLEAVWQSLG